MPQVFCMIDDDEYRITFHPDFADQAAETVANWAANKELNFNFYAASRMGDLLRPWQEMAERRRLAAVKATKQRRILNRAWFATGAVCGILLTGGFLTVGLCIAKVVR